MKVFYKLYLNSKSFEDPNEPDYLIRYAFNFDGLANQVDFQFFLKGEVTNRKLSKKIKKHSPELKDKKLNLEQYDSQIFDPIVKCITQ